MEKKISKAASKSFAIPVDLLKTFKKDIRFVPKELPANGWIIFDKLMLVSALRSSNVKTREELAKQIENLEKAGGELVIMQSGR